MALVKRKTRKAIEKSVRKIIKKHGPKIATGIATGVLSSLATMVGTEDDGSGKRKKKGKGSKFGDLLPSGKTLSHLPGVKQVAEMLPGSGSNTKASSKTKSSSARKAKRTKKQAQP